MVHKTTAGLINDSFSGVLALKLQQFTHPRSSLGMPNSTRHMPLLRPAAVAVHDDGDVVGDGSHSFCVEMSSLTSGGMGASGLSLPYTEKASQNYGFSRSVLEKLGFSHICRHAKYSDRRNR